MTPHHDHEDKRRQFARLAESMTINALQAHLRVKNTTDVVKLYLRIHGVHPEVEDEVMRDILDAKLAESRKYSTFEEAETRLSELNKARADAAQHGKCLNEVASNLGLRSAIFLSSEETRLSFIVSEHRGLFEPLGSKASVVKMLTTFG